MKILLVGDIVGHSAVEFLQRNLDKIKKQHAIDFVVANGENAASNGINVKLAEQIVNAGVDVITMGNHTFSRADEATEVLTSSLPVIRPVNFPKGTCGCGYTVVDMDNISILVVNAMGRVFIDPVLECPFRAMNDVLRQNEAKAQISIVDFHAEATSEKLAMLHHLDGRVTAVFGTHTHVQTADEMVTENGTAYITDIGMTGPVDSILGVKKGIILNSYMTKIRTRYEISENTIKLHGAIINVNEYTGKAECIERLIYSE